MTNQTTQFSIRCDLDYEVNGHSDFIFNVQPLQLPQQRVITEDLQITGARDYVAQHDPWFGNRYVRAAAYGGLLKLSYSAVLDLNHTWTPQQDLRELDIEELPVEVMPYVLPSRYCQSDRLIQIATQKFGSLPRGYARAQAVCDWVFAHLRFVPGTTNSQSSALDVMVQGTGVCRDFAHLTIAFLRALNIPARFITGYDYGADPIWGPIDFHAYVEVYLGDRWWIFDATRLVPRNGLIRIGMGRDAIDTAFATIFGPARMISMKLDIVPLAGEVADNRELALSTAGLYDAIPGAGTGWIPEAPRENAQALAA
jgi:transglutaminase-like putative cysteine protease